MCRRYQDAFFGQLAESEANPLLMTDDELRERFESYVSEMTERYSAPEADMKEVVEGIMEAYDLYANESL